MTTQTKIMIGLVAVLTLIVVQSYIPSRAHRSTRLTRKDLLPNAIILLAWIGWGLVFLDGMVRLLYFGALVAIYAPELLRLRKSLHDDKAVPGARAVKQ